MNKNIIQLNKVTKIYKMGEVEVPALRGVSINIRRGDFVAITGPSGSGKSTMMNLVGCLDVPTGGTIFLDGTDISKLPESRLAEIRGSKIGFIFQQFNLIPTLSALENVMLPLEFLDWDTEKAQRQAEKVLRLMDLGDRMNHLPSQLSGGQQQRVAIARALVVDPEVILADEPTGNLDSRTGLDVLDMMKKLWKKENKTIVLITHDLHIASHAHTQIKLRDGIIANGG
jgi:putative ABC transport system ATP-binding protein